VDDEHVIVREKIVPDGADRYAGRWIAIRGQEIVADAATLAELYEDRRVDERDLVYAVPPPGVHFY
jgi:hypothetical protein